DGVSFKPGSHAAGSPTYYVHDSLTPTGLPYDFEWVAGGPGGGSSGAVAISGDMQSFFCAASSCSNYTSIRSAWSSGADTAETISGLFVVNSLGLRDVGITASAADDPGVNLW
ncbi:MAG: thermopsin, partial [Thermoplasmata archaeon]|nr:thermopsin [Thermoplasmata archaeon]